MKPSHILQEALRSIGRNRGNYVLAATVQAVCLTLLSIFIVLTWNVLRLSEAAGRRVEVYAFLAETAEPRLLEERVSSMDGVVRTRYVTKDEALEELRQDLGTDDVLLEALGENPLPASIRVTVRSGFASVGQLDALEKKLMLMPGVAEVWSGREMLDRLSRIARTVLVLDFGVLAIVFCAVLFIVFQTVEAAISARRHEVEVMELVGASATAVRLPFIIEGCSQGILGGCAALLLVVLLHRVAGAFMPASILPFGLVALADLGLGVISGLAGSVMALNRILGKDEGRRDEG
jgi:cell division transport system permease protein